MDSELEYESRLQHELELRKYRPLGIRLGGRAGLHRSIMLLALIFGISYIIAVLLLASTNPSMEEERDLLLGMMFSMLGSTLIITFIWFKLRYALIASAVMLVIYGLGMTVWWMYG